jgi:hypothetical protein
MNSEKETEPQARRWFRGLTLSDLVTVAVFAAISRILNLATGPLDAIGLPWSGIYFTVIFFIPALVVATLVRRPGVLTLWAIAQWLIGVIFFGLLPVWIVSNLPFGLSGDLVLYFTGFYKDVKFSRRSLWKPAVAGFIMAWVESTWILDYGVLYGFWLTWDYYLLYVFTDSIAGLVCAIVGNRLGTTLTKTIH